MPKAILELEMPESCWECKIAFCDILEDDLYCPVTKRRTRITYYFNKKMNDCPLKLVEGKEVE